MTLLGTEPATLRFVAQDLKQLRHQNSNNYELFRATCSGMNVISSNWIREDKEERFTSKGSFATNRFTFYYAENFKGIQITNWRAVRH